MAIRSGLIMETSENSNQGKSDFFRNCACRIWRIRLGISNIMMKASYKSKLLKATLNITSSVSFNLTLITLHTLFLFSYCMAILTVLTVGFVLVSTITDGANLCYFVCFCGPLIFISLYDATQKHKIITWVKFTRIVTLPKMW